VRILGPGQARQSCTIVVGGSSLSPARPIDPNVDNQQVHECYGLAGSVDMHRA
jgi:hypothetical protein